MSEYVTVVGNPFLDLVFEGLPHLPSVDEEVLARSFHMVPGGSAIQAIGLARLGLSVALVSARGTDGVGRLLGDILTREKVRWIGPATADSPTTAIMSTPEGTAMATAAAVGEATLEDVAATDPRRVVLSLGRAGLRPEGVPACFVTGSIEIEAGVSLSELLILEDDVLVMNAREARAVTGEADVETSARMIARHGGTAVVTRGDVGAVGVRGDDLIRAPAVDVVARDATGAGDLFVAALVWAMTTGLPLRPSLEWACLFAGLSVMAPTALAGARRLEELLEEGKRRGLTPP
ncbi:MAG TPA: carbohydrate kinase family protein [Actinomycetota bacterium]|nr:carbohydrate kinase family protein [Actinomycetota bacterium]